MEKLTIQGVTELLHKEDIPQMILDVFSGKQILAY